MYKLLLFITEHQNSNLRSFCRKMSKIWIYALFEESYHYKFLPRGKLSLFPALTNGQNKLTDC